MVIAPPQARVTGEPAHSQPRYRGDGGRLALLGTALLLCIGSGLFAPDAGSFRNLGRPETLRYIAAALAAGAFYAAAVHLARTRALPLWALPAILVIGLAARLLVLAGPPFMSTDLYRYVWDGRVQAAGINPYVHMPAAPEVSFLRDPGAGPTAIFDNINRPDTAVTIYPPAAQALFALIGVTAPSIWTIKAAMLAFDLLATLAAIGLIRLARLPDAFVLIWFWNPLVIWEFANAGHIDAAAVAFSALALFAAMRARPALAGAALAVAVLFKLLPAALFPAIWRPRQPGLDWRVPIAAAAVIVLAYACYASAGWRVFGYLPGYAAEEGLGGSGFLLLRLAESLGRLPGWAGRAYLGCAGLVLAGLAAWVAFRPRPAEIAARTRAIGRDSLILSAALLAILSPHYPWYLTMLILPAVICPAWSALWPTVAGPLLYLDYGLDEVVWPAIVFLPTLLLLIVDLRSIRRTPALAQGAP